MCDSWKLFSMKGHFALHFFLTLGSSALYNFALSEYIVNLTIAGALMSLHIMEEHDIPQGYERLELIELL